METINIKPDADDFSSLLERLSNGEILVPTFQREFVWDNSMIRDLFDSILRGYPVGSLIFWKPSDEKFKVVDKIGGIKVKTHSSNALYVLDGRQRLTALMSVLNPGGCNFQKFYLNLKEDTVEYSRRPRVGHNYISLGDLYNTYAIIDYLDGLRESGLSAEIQKEYADKVKKYNRILMTYRLGFVTIKGGTIKEAVEVFSRLNSSGVSISPDYMLQALAYDSETDFRLASKITEIIDSLERYNFSTIKRDIVFNCLYNYADVPFIDGKISKLLDFGKGLPDICKRLETDLNRAVDFLYEKCHVIDYKLLPYSYQINMLADFFRLNPDPGEKEFAELKKWFFYTSYTGYFTSHSLAEIREDIFQIRAFALGKRSQIIKYEPITELDAPDNLYLNSVRVKSYVINVLTGEEIDGDSELVVKKIFPDQVKGIENCVIATDKAEATSEIIKLKDNGLTVDQLPARKIKLLNDEIDRLSILLGDNIVSRNLKFN